MLHFFVGCVVWMQQLGPWGWLFNPLYGNFMEMVIGNMLIFPACLLDALAFFFGKPLVDTNANFG